MYKQITSNKRKTAALMTLFLVFIIFLGFIFQQVYPEYTFILPVFVLLSVFWSLSSYFYSDKIVLRASRARKIKKQDNPYLYRIVENLTITTGLPMPDVYIISDPAMNAFAVGRDPKHSSIAVTEGLINKLENEELEGVIAHELSHIKNYDIRLQTVVVTLVGVVALMSDLFLRSFFWFSPRRREDRDGQFGLIVIIASIVVAILAPITAYLIQLAISRKREFLADSEAALITRYPEGLARALLKISQDRNQLKFASSATAHLYISNPFRKKGFVSKLFSTHPPIEERVKNLREMEV